MMCRPILLFTDSESQIFWRIYHCQHKDEEGGEWVLILCTAETLNLLCPGYIVFLDCFCCFLLFFFFFFLVT